MLKIGEFSKIAQVSIKTLRYYDRMGLLKPAHIDRHSSYRYYTLSQLPRLNRILALKDLDFSLDQIRELLDVTLPRDALRNLLENKAHELRDQIMDDRARLLRVETRLKGLQDEDPRPIPVVLKSAPHYAVATVRQVLPSLGELVAWRRSRLDEIHTFLNQLGTPSTGQDILIYHQEEYRDVDVDVEVGTIIKEARGALQPNHDHQTIQLRTLYGVNQLVTAIHTSSTGTLSETYASLAHWTQTNGFKPIGPWRELTFSQKTPTPEQVIEVQRPVMKATKFYTHLEVKKMEPKIVTRPAFTVVGLRYFGKNENQEIAAMWEAFDRRMETLGGLPHDTGEAAIGLCFSPDDDPMGGAFEYIAGLPVSKVEELPEGFVARQVPEHTYAVFAHKGDLPSLGKTYEYIYETWLPQSGYTLADNLDFEYYDDDFKDFAPDSIFYIYIPIKRE